jgi:hypothetical protein
MRSEYGLTVPIFGKNFSGHGFPNNRTRYRTLDFDGESDEGWGVHMDGSVDCIDIRKTRNWTLGVDPDTWQFLWNLEATVEENAMGSIANDKGGIASLINRLVITVHLTFTGTVFVPDSDQWAIFLPSPGWSLQGARGYAVPKPATDPKGAAVRAKIMRRRARLLEKCR